MAKKKAKTYAVVEVYNGNDGARPLVLGVYLHNSKEAAMKDAHDLAVVLMAAYNSDSDEKPEFNELWEVVNYPNEFGYDAAEDTINRNIRVVEVNQ